MLVFAFAGCVYFAAGRNLYVIPSEGALPRTFVITQVSSWFVLSFLYWHWRLPAAVVVHSAFPVLVIILFATFVMVFKTVHGGEALIASLAFSTLISFPMAIIAISIRGQVQQ